MIKGNRIPDGIAIEAPPANLPIEAQDYLHRLVVQISGQFTNMDKQIRDLTKRVATLESKVP